MPLLKGEYSAAGQAIVDVIIARPLDANLSGGDDARPFRALVDTGASVSCISSRVVEELELEREGEKFINTASHLIKVDSFFILFALPIRGKTGGLQAHNNLLVSRLPNTGDDYDMLLGMDVLRECVFLSQHGEFVLGFPASRFIGR